MESFSSASQKAQIDTEKEDQVVYVEELGGEGDYWLSITDAARVCRVQDVSIRRAIARGALPVRRQRAGQNKRTRFVRANDLSAMGFPIIDESAAITTEIGKADILSIPRQQQRILQDHQQLLGRLEELQQTTESYQSQLLADLQQQKEEARASLQTLQEEQARQLAATETRLQNALEKLQQSLADAEQHLTHEQQEARQHILSMQEETLQREASLQELIHAQEAALVAYQQEMKRSLAELEARQQQELQAYQQAIDARFQQAEQEARERLADLEQKMTGNLEKYARTVTTQLTALAEQLSQLQQFSANLDHEMATRKDKLDHVLQQQQAQIDLHARLLPLLPYAQQHLLTEQDRLQWTQTLAELEKKISAEQQREFARYQPLLDLLSPGRLESLARLLTRAEQEKSALESE